MSELWGPWIEHDGRGCPCRGMYVQAVHEADVGDFSIAEAIATGGKSWYWRNYIPYTRIIRYRIRKPKGMKILESLLKDLPETV